ncbi:MAG TPA: YihY/virulence factor BrkB family protein [Hyphomicrobium sp.]|nr:YihY/virulence factor BrkB family protein [Hyphomicrobium sp.]
MRMVEILKEATLDWSRHRSPRLGAALAYFAVFSLGPLLLLVTAVAGLFFERDAVRAALSAQFSSLIGPAGSQAIDAMIAGASGATSGAAAAGFGVVLLLLAALGVVVQLKDAINTIWEVPDDPGSGIWWYVRTYIVSLAGILTLGLLLAVSLVLSTVLAAFSSSLPTVEGLIWQGVDLFVSLAVLTGLFAMLFKFFPDAPVQWRDVVFGAVLTAVLFQLGKLAISWYIGTQGLESSYGAAASVVALLIWIYYAAQIILFGAEVTHVDARRRRRPQDNRTKRTL